MPIYSSTPNDLAVDRHGSRRIGDVAMGMERSDALSLRIRDGIDFQRDHFEEIPALTVACYDSRALNEKRQHW